MKRSEINSMLKNSAEIEQLAATVRDSFLNGDSGARNVHYAPKPHDPMGFIANVLHFRCVAKLEYSILESNTGPVFSAQYSFYCTVDGQELRLPTVLRVVGPKHIVLPGDDVVNLSSVSSVGAQGETINTSISNSLLSWAFSRIERWKFQA